MDFYHNTVTAVIVTTGDRLFTDVLRCLESSILRPTSTVIVNVSSKSITPFRPGCIWIDGLPQNGFSGNCNIGIRRALEENPSLILIIGDDVMVTPHCTLRLAEAAIKNGSAFSHTFNTNNKKSPSGNLWMIKADALKQCLPSPFDESICYYGEDIRLYYRLNGLGYINIHVSNAWAVRDVESRLPEHTKTKCYWLARNTTRNTLEFHRDYGWCFYVLTSLITRHPKYIFQTISGSLSAFHLKTLRNSNDPQKF